MSEEVERRLGRDAGALAPAEVGEDEPRRGQVDLDPAPGIGRVGLGDGEADGAIDELLNAHLHLPLRHLWPRQGRV